MTLFITEIRFFCRVFAEFFCTKFDFLNAKKGFSGLDCKFCQLLLNFFAPSVSALELFFNSIFFTFFFILSNKISFFFCLRSPPSFFHFHKKFFKKKISVRSHITESLCLWSTSIRLSYVNSLRKKLVCFVTPFKKSLESLGLCYFFFLIPFCGKKNRLPKPKVSTFPYLEKITCNHKRAQHTNSKNQMFFGHNYGAEILSALAAFLETVEGIRPPSFSFRALYLLVYSFGLPYTCAFPLCLSCITDLNPDRINPQSQTKYSPSFLWQSSRSFFSKILYKSQKWEKSVYNFCNRKEIFNIRAFQRLIHPVKEVHALTFYTENSLFPSFKKRSKKRDSASLNKLEKQMCLSKSSFPVFNSKVSVLSYDRFTFLKITQSPNTSIQEILLFLQKANFLLTSSFKNPYL
jgi:hypothetical protein